MLHAILVAVQIVSALCILVLVMLQRGKGAEAGAGFGAGASGTVFGARGATTALSRATAIFAAIFMINSLALAYMGTRAPTERPKTLLVQAATPESTNPAPATGAPAAPAVQTPAPAPEAPQSGAGAPATSTPSPTPQQ